MVKTISLATAWVDNPATVLDIMDIIGVTAIHLDMEDMEDTAVLADLVIPFRWIHCQPLLEIIYLPTIPDIPPDMQKLILSVNSVMSMK